MKSEVVVDVQAKEVSILNIQCHTLIITLQKKP